MGIRVLENYELGDMQARYFLDEETGQVQLMLLPEGMEPVRWEEKSQQIDSLLQFKLAGDPYTGAYAGGKTMRQNSSVTQMKFAGQRKKEGSDQTEIITCYTDARGYEAEHHLVWMQGKKYLESRVVFRNRSSASCCLEMLESFSIGGLTPFEKGDAPEHLWLHRLRSDWSMEGRMESDPFEKLNLEPSWAGHGIRCERFGQIGSMAVNHFFPWVIAEDRKNQVFWGASVAHNASWQIEVYRKDDSASLSGGLADYDFGHWMKKILPGEEFSSPTAFLTVATGTVDSTAQRLTSAMKDAFLHGPESEQELPVMFNEYCTTWGCPSHENITEILQHLKGKGLKYFVIDCGWFKKDGVSWDISMGDYQISETLFPEGLEKTVEAIKNAGMVPGIWFEIDNVGCASEAWNQTEHLLKRGGYVLETSARRFWDMTDPWVENYLTDRVIGTLQKYGFGYMKMDYNDTIGTGCDGAESMGEGLRKNMEASSKFIEKVKEKLPGIVLENCASGGSKMEPLMMRLCSMASFSDAHECPEIPLIAASLHRAILPAQSQIWAVIRETDSLKRICYSMAAAFLGRLCLSGDVRNLTEEQWKVIDNGISFYHQIAPVILEGSTEFYGTAQSSWRHPKGWQGILRTGGEEGFAVFHTFGGEIADIPWIELSGRKEAEILSVYSDSVPEFECRDGKLFWNTRENWKAAAVRFRLKK